MVSLYAHDPFQAVQAALAARWLDGPMFLLTSACEGWVLALVATAWILTLRRPPREMRRDLLDLVVALLLAGAAVQLVKALVNEPRPLAVLGPASVRVVGEALYRRSLPSGHAAAVAALAAAAAVRFGIRAWPLVLLAVLGGVSRIYVGAHWVLDVAAGWTLGALAGLAAAPLTAAAQDLALALRSGPAVRPADPRSAVRRTDQRALVCVPTYDERGNLEPLLAAVFAAAPGVEVLVIDDASPDGTGALADELAARDPRVHVLHRARKDGLGKAYLAGFGWALERGYDLVLEMDADFSHDPRTLPTLVTRAADADLVLGSRWVAGGSTAGWGLPRRLLSAGGSLYARTILGVPVQDLTGGFKCFRREVLEAIDLPSVASTGYAFQIELTYRAHRAGFRVAEVPIRFEDRRVGRSKMSGSIVLEAMGRVWTMRGGVARATAGRAIRAT